MRNIYEFLRLSTKLRDKYEVHLPKPTITFLGSYNTGKSTLINGLLRTDINPVDIVPSTKGFIFFNYGPSFYAEVHTGKFKTKQFKRIKEFINFITNKSNDFTFEWARVFLKNPILEQLNLVDVPGIDGPFINRRTLEKLIRDSDYIIYLFHQRGIEEYNKRFLLQLTKKYMQHNQPKISFWINCNLGCFDGSSLKETNSVLKEIFPNQFDLNTINTTDPYNLKLFLYYLEMNLALRGLEQVKEVIKQKDIELEHAIGEMVNTSYDAAFLLKFAHIKEIFEELIEDQKWLINLPKIKQQFRKVLDINNKLNINNPIKIPNSNTVNKKIVNFNTVKSRLLNLIDRILEQPNLKFLDHRALGTLAGKIKKESFTIVAAGGFSSGKSTFFNALIGEELLPTQSKPTTFAITQISYGTTKKAVIYFSQRVTLRLYDRIDGKIEPRNDELNTLNQWLQKHSAEINSYEVYQNKHFRESDRKELLKIVNNFQELFRDSMKNPSDQIILKIIPEKLTSLNKITEQVRITFKASETVNFDLTDETGLKNFYSTINCTSAFRVERVEVFHPSEYLKLASFLDTPGLDSTHKYHSEITTDYLQNSDAYLIFLNARHLLMKQEQANPVKIIFSRINDYLKVNPTAYQKIFFIINFADSLTQAELEKTHKFVNQQFSTTVIRPQIHTISSMSALLHKDDRRFNKLLKNLEIAITNYRGKEVLLRYIREIKYILNTTINSGSIKNSINKTHTNNLNLPKYSASYCLLKNKPYFIQEIKSRFFELGQYIKQLNSERDFKGFMQGIQETKKGFFKTIKAADCPSYFRWVTDLNDYVAHYCKKTTEQIEKYLNEQISRTFSMSNIQLNITPPPPTIKTSSLLTALSIELKRKRGLFGFIREREVHRELTNLIEIEQKELIQSLNKWEIDLLKKIRLKIAPIYACTNSIYPITIQKKSSVMKTHNPLINNFLKELKEIKILLEHPGGNCYGKCKNP